MQERLKKEYKSANKQRDTGIDESEEEDESQPTSKQSKAMQKLIKNRVGIDAYVSDEDKNPYASSVRICLMINLYHWHLLQQEEAEE